MNNINVEKIKQTLKKTKKLVLQKTLPFILATGFLVGTGTSKAEAANVTFPTISISYDKDLEYANEANYKSNYVTDSQAEKIEKEIQNIDDLFNKLYESMANGAFDIKHTNSKENSMARFLANINEINNTIDSSNATTTEKSIINKYLESKIAEAKLVFYDITNISTKDLNNFESKYTCVFADSLNRNNLVNIGIYEIKNDNIINSKIVTIDDSKLSTTKSLIIVPKMTVVYNGSIPSFKTTYETEIIAKDDLKLCNQAMSDVDIFYSKIEKALESGNYKKKTNQNATDIYLSLYGDTNLVGKTINEKYKDYKEILPVINKYLLYKQTLLASKVYGQNNMKYTDYVNYQINNNPIRYSEDNGFVYYQTNSKIVSIIDSGYLKTSDLKSSVSKLIDVKLNIYTGINIYVDGKLYSPEPLNGVVGEPFVYNGTTYLPLRDITCLYNADIKWQNNSVYITKSNNEGQYYIDENGNKVYLDYPSFKESTKTPSSKLTLKEVTGLKGVKIYFNNTLYTPQAINGIPTEVYIVNGTTYLPVRDIAKMFDTEIKWNQETNSVILNRNVPVLDDSEYYYEDENGNKHSVSEDDIDFGNNIINKPYYYDENGNKVYIGEDDYQKTR